MSRSAKLSVLAAHANATWHVWLRHLHGCTNCQQARTLHRRAGASCLACAAALEEWVIAERRYSVQAEIEGRESGRMSPGYHNPDDLDEEGNAISV